MIFTKGTPMEHQPFILYDLQEISSTIVPDTAGNGFAGVLRNDGYGGAFVRRDTVFGRETNTLYFTGGCNGGYLQLPDGAADNSEGITICCFACIRDTPDPGCLFSFGKDVVLAMLTYPDENDPERIILYPSFSTAGRSQEASCHDTVLSVKKGQWFHLSLALSADVPSKAIVAVDGRPAASFSHRRAGASALSGAVFNCFGNGSYAAAPLPVSFGKIRVFHEFLPENALAGLFHIPDKARFGLELGYLREMNPLLFSSSSSGTQSPLISEAFLLPSSGQYGCSFFWEFDSACFISEAVNNENPALSGLRLIPVRPEHGLPPLQTCITLTAAFSRGSLTEKFFAGILPLPSDKETAEAGLRSISFSCPS
ncbi:MAG: hypothetical protein IKN57_09675, partial [Parasporobacterium sp.]|nr:hypothetical protein [Parasporobacterium sp.]